MLIGATPPDAAGAGAAIAIGVRLTAFTTGAGLIRSASTAPGLKLSIASPNRPYAGREWKYAPILYGSPSAAFMGHSMLANMPSDLIVCRSTVFIQSGISTKDFLMACQCL